MYGRDALGRPAWTATWPRLVPDVAAVTALVAGPLPDDLAARLGRTAGEVHLGAWFG